TRNVRRAFIEIIPLRESDYWVARDSSDAEDRFDQSAEYRLGPTKTSRMVKAGMQPHEPCGLATNSHDQGDRHHLDTATSGDARLAARLTSGSRDRTRRDLIHPFVHFWTHRAIVRARAGRRERSARSRPRSDWRRRAAGSSPLRSIPSIYRENVNRTKFR